MTVAVGKRQVYLHESILRDQKAPAVVGRTCGEATNTERVFRIPNTEAPLLMGLPVEFTLSIQHLLDFRMVCLVYNLVTFRIPMI